MRWRVGWGSPFLTPRAKVRGSLGDQHPPDGSAAIYAGLAGALIHTVANLEKSLAPLGIHVIGDRGAAGGNGFGEHLAESLVQTHDAILAQSGGNRHGVNPGAEERFIGVDVPQIGRASCRERVSLSVV